MKRCGFWLLMLLIVTGAFLGGFFFGSQKTTETPWHRTDITEGDLQVGDTISVTFVGASQETDPVYIFDVMEIILLDDEK